MKKLLFLTAFTLCLFNLQAQKINLLAYGGGLTGSRIYSSAKDVRVKGEWCYGAGLEFDLDRVVISLLWTEAKTRVTEQLINREDMRTNLTINYYKLGFQRYLTEGKVRPYTQLTLGASQGIPTGGGSAVKLSGEQWFFATTFGLGIDAPINDKIAIRVQAAANMPLEMGGAGIFCSFGGCQPNIYFNPILFQGEFTAGIAYTLSEK
jgi:hypothetical protein